MDNYKIDSNKYTFQNALLWGNCKEHFKKSIEKGQTWSGSIVHALICLLEAIPILGQIASLAEKAFSQTVTESKPITGATYVKPPVYTVPKEAKKGTEALNILRDMIKEGTVIDRDYIMINYPKLIEKVGKENEPEARKMINEAYLQQLRRRVESGDLPLPQALLALLKHQDKENLIQENEEGVRNEIIKLLKNVNIEDKEPIDFVNELRNLLFDCIAKKVSQNSEQQEKFKEDLTQLHKIELRWVTLKGTGKDFIRDELIPEYNKMIDELPGDEKFKELIKEKFREEMLKMAIPDKTQRQLEEVLKDDSSTSTLEERVEKKLKEPSLKSFKGHLDKQAGALLVRLSKEIEDANDWMKKYHCTHLVKYSQSAGGNDEILGEGCCYAINLKWGKQLGALGAQKIISLKQLQRSEELEIDTVQSENLRKAFNISLLEKGKLTQSSKSSESDEDWEEVNSSEGYTRDDSEDNVKARERFVQARYAMKMHFKSPTPELGDGDYQVKDLKKEIKNSLGEMLQEINSDNQFDPAGFLELSIFNINEDGGADGHAIGCKIDHIAGLYHFGILILEFFK